MNLTTIAASILCISTLASTSVFAQTEIPTVRPSLFSNIEVNKLTNVNGEIELVLYGSVKYSNDCMVSDQKTKKVSLVNGELHYQVYSGQNETRICPKIYKPVNKTYIIDRLVITGNPIHSIFVNEKQVY